MNFFFSSFRPKQTGDGNLLNTPEFHVEGNEIHYLRHVESRCSTFRLLHVEFRRSPYT